MHGATMSTLNRDNGYINMRLVTFAGIMFGVCGWVVVVSVWLVRMLLL
jgi:hypothetical protein